MSGNTSYVWNADRISTMLDISDISIWSLCMETGSYELSNRTRELLELPADYQLSHANFQWLFENANPEYWFEIFKKSWIAGGRFDATIRLKTFKGNWIWTRIRSVTETDEKNRIICVLGTIQDITETKEQELILRKQKMELERNHRLLIKAEQIGRLGHWILSKGTNTFSLSEEVLAICGLQPPDDLQYPIWEFINPQTINWSSGALPQPGTYVHQITTAAGKKKWVEVNVDANFEDSESIFGTIQDITNEIQSKKEAITNEARQKAIINAIPNAFLYTDARGKILQVNKAFNRFFQVEDPAGSDLYEMVDFLEAGELQLLDERLIGGEQASQQVETRVRVGKTVKSVRIYKNHFKNSTGKIVGLIALLIDMTDEVKRNAKVLLTNKQLNLAIGGANAGFFIYDIKKDINYWDEKSSEMFGFLREPQVGVIADFFAILHPEDREWLQKEKNTNYEGITKIDNHYRIVKKGEVRYINAQGVVERNEKGSPVRILGIHFDETDRMLAAQQLAEQEKKYRRIFESIKDGYLVTDFSGTLLEANPAAAVLLGYKKPEKLIGKRFTQLCRESSGNLTRYGNALRSGASLKGVKIEMIRGDGNIIMADFHANLVTYDDRSIIEATFRDVTEDILTQDRILTATVNAEDNQRKRIAQALHDSVQQLLITSKINFESFRAIRPNMTPQQKQKFELGLKFLEEGLQEARAVAHEIMPATVEDFGIDAAIEGFLTYLNRSTNIHFHYNSNIAGMRFNAQLEISLYRILQEASNNIIKYAQATEAHIQLTLKGKMLYLTIEDNGIGFDQESGKMERSFGITGMKTRATSIGAIFEIDSKIGHGTHILVGVNLME